MNFRDPQKSDCWNPLAVPYQYFQIGQIDKAMEMINDIALNIMYDDDKNKDPFWEQSAVDYFIGLALGLCEDASPEQITLNNISYMNTSGQERFATSNFIKEYFLLKNKYSNAYTCASGTIEARATQGPALYRYSSKNCVFLHHKRTYPRCWHTVILRWRILVQLKVLCI